MRDFDTSKKYRIWAIQRPCRTSQYLTFLLLWSTIKAHRKILLEIWDFFAWAGFCRSSNFTNLKLFKIVLSCKSLTFHVTERAHFTYKALNLTFIWNIFCKRFSEFNTVQEKMAIFVEIKKKTRILKLFSFSKLNVKKSEGLRPSLFCNFKIEIQNYFKFLIFYWFQHVLPFFLNCVEFWNSFTKSVWNKAEIQYFVSKMCSFRYMKRYILAWMHYFEQFQICEIWTPAKPRSCKKSQISSKILRCAFMVLHKSKNVKYWDVWNGVG